MKLYVGNLSYDMTDDSLRQAFAAIGKVDTAQVVKDMQTGRSKGFGFVEMPNAQEAQDAIAKLNGTEVMGRNLNVNEARPKTENRGGGGSYGGGGGRSW
jgi:RNA recognition motif-containing protein